MDSNYGMNRTDVSDIVTSTSGMPINFIVLCHFYALLKQWVSEESIGPNINTIKPDTGISSDSGTAFLFSTADCERYNRSLAGYDYDQCEAYHYDKDLYTMWQLKDCLLIFFMTKMGAREKCSNIYLGYDNNTNDDNAIILLPKTQIFYSFMTDSLSLRDVCGANTTGSHVTDGKKGISTTNSCDFYIWFTSLNAEERCRPASENDTLSNDTAISHYGCVWYHLKTGLEARIYCKWTEEEENQLAGNNYKQAGCDMYNFVMGGIIGGSVSGIGIVCNIVSLIVFRHGVIKTPTTYQLQCLALVDTVFLVLCFICINLVPIINYLQIDPDTLYHRLIEPYIVVYIRPLWQIAQTSTNWLTLFTGVYRYLTICKPTSNSYGHVERHRRKYVLIVLSLAAVWNIPYFFVHNLSQDDEISNKIDYVQTSFGEKYFFELVYNDIMHPALTVCLPVIILLILTVEMIVVLRKKQSNMQNSNTSNLSINIVLVTVLLTFIICQSPLLVYSILYEYDPARIKTLMCGSFHFYFSGLVFVFVILNSAANPFIYVVLRNHFTWPLKHTVISERAETIAMGSI